MKIDTLFRGRREEPEFETLDCYSSPEHCPGQKHAVCVARADEARELGIGVEPLNQE